MSQSAYIGIGIALAIVLFLVWSRRAKALLRRTGVPAVATIVRMEGGASGTNSARLYTLTLTWTAADGRSYTAKADKRCATANMPQQGDSVKILYIPQRPDVVLFADEGPLRRDGLPQGGTAR